MQESDTARGQIIFDERDVSILERRVRRNKIAIIGFSFIFFVFAFSFLFLFWISPRHTDFWTGFMILWFVVFTFSLAIIVLLAGFGRPYVLLFENGIEFYGGFLHRKEYFPFRSIVKAYTRIYDESGIKLDYILLILDETSEKNYKVLGEGLFVDNDRFLELLRKKVSIDSKPEEEKDLGRELREKGILGRFETLR